MTLTLSEVLWGGHNHWDERCTGEKTAPPALGEGQRREGHWAQELGEGSGKKVELEHVWESGGQISGASREAGSRGPETRLGRPDWEATLCGV